MCASRSSSLALPALTSFARGVALVTNGPASTLPAYVAAEGRGDEDVGTIVLTPQNSGGVASQIVWGGSETLDGQSTSISTATEATPQDTRVADLTADLVTSTSGDAVAATRRGRHPIRASRAGGRRRSRTPRARCASRGSTALNQRDALDAVGDTAKGTLWRVTSDIADRAGASADVTSLARLIATLQFVFVGIALLLALPTAASRRAARRTPRVVGPHWREGR